MFCVMIAGSRSVSLIVTTSMLVCIEYRHASICSCSYWRISSASIPSVSERMDSTA